MTIHIAPMNSDTTKKLTKYLIEGLAVAVVTHILRKQGLRDSLMIGLVAATTLLILDTFAPSVSSGARLGVGFGIGSAQLAIEPMDGYNSDDDLKDDEDGMDY